MDHSHYLTAQQVCARFGGISAMTLWRWCRDPELGFPVPIRVNRRRFFKEADVLAFETDRAGSL